MTSEKHRRNRRYTEASIMEGERVTVRLPPDLCAALDTLVDDDVYPNKSDAVRAALRQQVTE